MERFEVIGQNGGGGTSLYQELQVNPRVVKKNLKEVFGITLEYTKEKYSESVFLRSTVTGVIYAVYTQYGIYRIGRGSIREVPTSYYHMLDEDVELLQSTLTKTLNMTARERIKIMQDLVINHNCNLRFYLGGMELPIRFKTAVPKGVTLRAGEIYEGTSIYDLNRVWNRVQIETYGGWHRLFDSGIVLVDTTQPSEVILVHDTDSIGGASLVTHTMVYQIISDTTLDMFMQNIPVRVYTPYGKIEEKSIAPIVGRGESWYISKLIKPRTI